MGVEEDIDVVVGTLSKALGGIGGFIAASQSFIDWVINTAGSFIYTTAIPPAACAAAAAALELVINEPWRREKLLRMANDLGMALRARGFDTSGSTSQIVPVILGDNEVALRLSHHLEENGILAPAIRPPTVPRGRARLRISLTAEHEEADIEHLLNALGASGPP